jgi:type 1 glutamine amidotransferase
MLLSSTVLAFMFALGCVSGLAQRPFPGHDLSKIQVLLLTGYNSTPIHRWREIDPQLRDILERTGRFQLRINEEPRGITSDTLAGYQVLLIDYSDYTPSLGVSWPEQTRQAYLEFLRSGGGVVGFHVVIGSFPEWPEFHRTLGIADNSKVGHGPYHNFVVKVVAPENPIVRGIPASFEGWGEVYNRMELLPGAQVLARAWDDPNNCLPNRVACGTGKEEPILWTNHYGAGRVFVTTLGHDLKSISSPEFKTTLVQGTEWAANGKVDDPRIPMMPK